MPKSDTWPGGTVIETLAGMDSAGSCDSVVSINSSCSDDSLEQLSAEERACLMFLEETIESLEVEEDSGLSNDEPDILPPPGSLAAKMADLSSSMDRSKLDYIKKYPLDGSIREVGRDKPVGYLVPTPLVLANNSSSFKVGPGIVTAVKKQKGCQGLQKASSEVSAVDISPSSPFRDASTESKGDQGGQRPNSAPSRGPLSYEGLLQLRNRASLKKTTQTSSSEIKEKPKPASSHPPDGSKSTFPSNTPPKPTPLNETPKPKASPPAVAPKPKMATSNIFLKSQNVPVPDSSMNSQGTSPTERIVMDPQKVRREALRKLGLLQDKEDVAGPAVGSLRSPKSRLQDPPPVNPASALSKAPAPAILQDPPPYGNRQRSRSHLSEPSNVHPARPFGVKSATLERSDVGLGNYMASQASHSSYLRSRSRTTSLGDRKEVKDSQLATIGQATTQKLQHPYGFSLARQEALRKLGLLRD